MALGSSECISSLVILPCGYVWGNWSSVSRETAHGRGVLMGEIQEDHEEQGHHCHHGSFLTLSSSGRLQVHGGYNHVGWLLGGEDRTFRTLNMGAPVHSSQTPPLQVVLGPQA